MATKKPAATAVAKIKAAPLPADYDEQAAINAFKSRLSVSETNKIQVTQDKHFKVPMAGGDAEKVNVISGIIVDFSSRKNFYENGFDRDNPTPPNCFAIGFMAHDNLLPDEDSPEAQGETCRACARNQWEKDAKGKWIAPECKSSYRLALIAPDDDGKGRLLTLDLSSTATKEFDKYVRSLANLQKAPYHVVTEFSFDPKSEYPSVRCEMINEVPKNGLGFIVGLRDEATTLVSRKPNLEGFEEKVAAKRLPAPKGKTSKPRKAA